MTDDFDLIVSSFLSEYGVRIYSDDFKSMTWDEFAALLGGLSADSPLVRMVRIRSETDRNVLRHFTKAQHKIRNDWIRRSRGSRVSAKTAKERDTFLQELVEMFRKGG